MRQGTPAKKKKTDLRLLEQGRVPLLHVVLEAVEEGLVEMLQVHLRIAKSVILPKFAQFKKKRNTQYVDKLNVDLTKQTHAQLFFPNSIMLQLLQFTTAISKNLSFTTLPLVS